MAKTQIATRIDDTLKRRIDDYAERHDVTKAEAQRHLLARGIDYEEGRLSSPGSGDGQRVAGDVLRIVQNMAAFGAGCAGISLGIIAGVIILLGISPTWVTMMLTTAVASVAFGGAVTWAVVAAARSSWASVVGLTASSEVAE
jgi:predicted transcriptional regulator